MSAKLGFVAKAQGAGRCCGPDFGAAGRNGLLRSSFPLFFLFFFFLTSEGGFGPKLDRGASAQNSIEELIAFAHGVQRLGATKMLGAS
jgi:hypothetical protein